MNANYKSQINQLTTQVNHILTTLDETKDTNPKHGKRGVIHSFLLISFLMTLTVQQILKLLKVTLQFCKKTKTYSVIKYRKHSILLT